MEITIHRKNGFFENAYGRSIPLAILFDGTVVGHLATGETLPLSLPDVCGTLQVGLLDSTYAPDTGRQSDAFLSISKALEVSPGEAVQAFSVRTRGWVFFDVVGLAYLPLFSRRVLALTPERG